MGKNKLLKLAQNALEQQKKTLNLNVYFFIESTLKVLFLNLCKEKFNVGQKYLSKTGFRCHLALKYNLL